MENYLHKNYIFRQLIFAFLFFSTSIINFSNAQGFVDITQLDGMTIVHDGEDPSLPVKGFATGAVWIDINNDDYLDLYITMRTGANLLFKNLGPDGNGDITWDEIAVLAGVQDASNDGAGVVVGDFNNDGFDDLYLANVSEDVLFKNNGDDTFTDITAGSGLIASGDSRGNSASWGDYDGDGYLDLYIAQHQEYPGSSNSTHQDFFFHNNGDGTFTDVSSLLGTSNLIGYGFIAGWVDYDNDGDMDIILINDCDDNSANPDATTRTKIFRNDSDISSNWQTWIFTEVGASVGVDDCRNGMGIAVGDLNRDGWLDFAYTNIGDCVLFKNDGDGTFTDISATAGIDGQNSIFYSWGTAFFDYDLDGWQDLYFVFGSLWYTSNVEPKPNEFYKNNGDDTFTNMAASLNMADTTKSRSGIFGDYDNDGDVDVFLVNYGEACILKENTNNNGNNWLQVSLIGNPNQNSNKNAIGARLKLTDGNGVIQYYEIRSGSNLGGGDDLRAYFGLGSASTITELEITWPSGDVQTELGIGINQLIEIEESIPLPIVLVDFIAKPLNDFVKLEWTTESEINNDYFTIQRSANGHDFEKIGVVSGNGNTTTTSFYSFIDKSPLKGNNYYRLEQRDFDGTTSLSPIELVRFQTQTATLQVIPNPVSNGQFEIKFTTPDKEVVLEIIDVFGKVILQESFSHDGFETSKIISTENLPDGIYFLRLSGYSNQQVAKIVVR
jgi:enediyne biosynthesis protein E4